MPAFAYIGTLVATSATVISAVGAFGAAILGGIAAVGAAFVTSRIINGNPNKGNNSAAGSQGGRIQVPPATNNKIPVVYGSAFVNGTITDARLISLENKVNDVMYYCIVLSETCNNPSAVYTIANAYYNDLRLTYLTGTTETHIVKDGRKTVDGPGEDFIDTNFIINTNRYVEMRIYAGGSDAANQIFPVNSGNKANAYNYWGSSPANPNGDGSWDSTYDMKGLVFAIVRVRYNGEKGFTGLPNMTFELNNNISNPADVWYDYMTSERYGAGIDPSFIDTTAQTTWSDFCNEDINYTNKDGTANQYTERYTINGVIDTSIPVKTNIDTILQNAGAWMSYNVATGLWSPIIKKAITAGSVTDTGTFFTASRSGTTLTVTNFPEGRIEAGQELYDSTGTFIGYISSQITPLTAGETTGQKGRYTTSTSGSISSTTFFTLAPNLLQFNDDNIISGISLSSTRLDDLYNKVETEFYDKHNKDQKAYFRTDLPSSQRNPNEPDNQLRMSLDLVNNSMQADLLGQMELRQSRDDLVIEFTTNQYGIQAQAGDVIAVTSELYDWAPKYFRVMRVKEQETEDGGLVATIQALEYNADAYTIEPITEFTTEANIGIGVYGASPNLPAPPIVYITEIDTNVPIPNFQLQIKIPPTGGPYDEIELYYTEGWDPMDITGWIDNNSTPGTYSGVAGNIMTVTSTPYGSINAGDYFDLGGVTVLNQLTNTPVSKTYASGGAIAANTVTLNNTTGLIIGNRLSGTGLPEDGAYIIAIAGSQVTLDNNFTVQAAGTYTIEGGLGTYTVNTTIATQGTDTLYDLPINSDYKYLKKVTPTGDNPTFTNGETVTVVITEVPANSATYRRWFLKARLGIKKRFGAFSDPSTIDRDGNFRYNPSPTGGGSLNDLTDVTITSPNEGQTLYYDATTSQWKNNSILEVNDNTTKGGITVGQGITQPFITFETQAQGANAMYGIRGMSALDDPWFVGSGSTGNDSGYLEIATGDNSGTGDHSGGQIYVRQYNGQGAGGAPWYGGTGTVQTELILLDNDGDTFIPNNLTVDSGTLFVDATNGRVGINDTTPSYTLDVNGTANIETSLTVPTITTLTGDPLSISAISGQDVTITADLSTNPVVLARNTTNTNGFVRSARLQVNSTGTSAAGLTNAIEFYTETAPTVFKSGTYISSRVTNVATGSESFDLDIILMKNNVSTTVATLDSSGNLQIDGDITVSSNIINSSSAAAIELSGADVIVQGDLNIKGTNLILNSDGTGTEDVSITVERGATDATITWDETNDKWSISNGATIGNIDIDLTNGQIDTNGGVNLTLDSDGGTVLINDNLNVDSGVLYVDATNNRVGINDTTPSVALDVTGSIKATADVQGDSLTATNRIDAAGVIEQYSTGLGPSVESQVFYYTATGNSLQTVNSWSPVGYITGKYTISMRKGTDYHCIEIMVLTDGTTAWMNSYGEMFSNASLGTFSVDIDPSSPNYARLRITPATIGSLEIVIERKLFINI